MWNENSPVWHIHAFQAWEHFFLEAHTVGPFTTNFPISIKMEIWFYSNSVPVKYFANKFCAGQLSCHVRNFMANSSLTFSYKQNDFSIKFELQWNNHWKYCITLTYAIERGSTLYSEGSFVRRFFSPKPFEVAMVRRTYGPKVLYSEVPLLRKLLCSEDSIFRKAPHYMDSMLRRFFSPKFI